MRIKNIALALVISVLFAILPVMPSGEDVSAASTLPALAVSGQYLVEKDSGEKVQLRGLSTHGINWYKNLYANAEMPAYLNSSYMSELAGWGANCIRLAFYINDWNGYLEGNYDTYNFSSRSALQSALLSELYSAIDAATAAGLYVIVDWHAINFNPANYTSEAVSFFSTVSKKYANSTNILYEICNEPASGTWSSIKSYSNSVIPAIRANDNDAVVIVGTPTWSQDVDTAASDPLSFSNVMYTLHFYAATHGSTYRDKLQTALNKGLPVFVTEFGISEASGNGSINESEANTWISMLDKYNISYMMWSISNKAESASIFNSSCTKTSGFSTSSDLTQSGKWIYKLLSSKKVEADEIETGINYRTHVQDYGWQAWKSNGSSSGTTGKSKRLEAINIKLNGVSGGIRYRTHVQSYGWQDWVSNGTMSGTSGESKRLEAIRIELTGDAANNYDVYYRVHAQHFGWLDWAKNGEIAGTAGYSYRLESIQIKLVAKGGSAPGSTTTPYHVARVRYQTHVQNVGWQSLVGEGIMSGTSGKSLRLEGIKISLANKPCSGGITYRTHVQNIGWQDWVSDGAMSGTSGRSLRLEAIQIKLTGQMAEEYDVYYRVHAQNFGWLDWAKNGETSGTTGYSYRLEAIEIVLLPKGTTDSSMSTARPYVVK